MSDTIRSRLPRYAVLATVGMAAIWGPIGTYLATAPLSYTSRTSLILPGAGASASVQIDEIGSASSHAASAFASNAVSPTETYKRLLGADRIVDAAATTWGGTRQAFGRPRVELVDQTGFIHFTLTAGSPEESQQKGEALLAAFFDGLDALRDDEAGAREGGGDAAIAEYRASVSDTRAKIETLRAGSGILRPAQYDALVAANDILRDTLATARTALADATREADALRATLGLDAAMAATMLRLVGDARLSGLSIELTEAAGALSDADSRFGARHPRVVTARADFDAARTAHADRVATLTGLTHEEAARLEAAPEGARAALLARLVELDAHRAGMAAEVDAQARRHAAETARLAGLAPRVAHIEALERDYDVAEAVFASAIARARSVRADVYAAYPMVQVLENPSLPDRATSPRRKLALAAGVMATLMMLIGLMLGWARRSIVAAVIAPRASVPA
ncbi:hypothetical protein N9W17_02550 [Jannaschia sp.]|nr:hypothetical protein [Jannaschia sp.]